MEDIYAIRIGQWQFREWKGQIVTLRNESPLLPVGTILVVLRDRSSERVEEYWEVVECTKRTAWLQPLATRWTDEGVCLPMPGVYYPSDIVLERRITSDGTIRVDNKKRARVWEGHPEVHWRTAVPHAGRHSWRSDGARSPIR